MKNLHEKIKEISLDGKPAKLISLQKKHRRHQAIIIQHDHSKIFGPHTTVYLATPNGRVSQYLNGYEGIVPPETILKYIGIQKTQAV